MEWILELLTNRFALTALSSWFAAQVIKTVLHLIIERKLDWTRLILICTNAWKRSEANEK